jgi:hypothetical protein
VRPDVAAELGLAADVVVAAGGQDQKCAALGAGIHDGAATLSTDSLVLRPGQRFVFRYEGLSLRNDANTVIRLLDAAGALVDETPAFRDVYDNGKTWQRIPDGGDPVFPLWLLRWDEERA